DHPVAENPRARAARRRRRSAAETLENPARRCRSDARFLDGSTFERKTTRQEGNRGRTTTMLKPILLGGALALLPVAQLNAEPIWLKLNSPAPPWSFVNKEVLGPWAEAVTAASDGTLQVQTFYGGTLGNFGNTYDRVVDQVVDVGFILFAFASGKFKQQDVAALPFEAETSVLSSVALWNI